MAFGSESGQFTIKLTGQTFQPCSVDRVSIQANMEGTASGELGEGEIALTHYAEGVVGEKNGTWRQYGGGN